MVINILIYKLIKNFAEHIHIATNVYEYKHNFTCSVNSFDYKFLQNFRFVEANNYSVA